MANPGMLADQSFEVRTQLVDIAIAAADLQPALYKADREARFLNDFELSTWPQWETDRDWIRSLQRLRNESEAIVNDARADLLACFPGLTEPGGGLYPASRAAACWRDLWHFLRCVTYGIALGQPVYTHAQGLIRLRQLYQKLGVPLDAMVAALEALKRQSLARLSPAQAAQQTPFFDHLIEQLRTFQQPMPT